MEHTLISPDSVAPAAARYSLGMLTTGAGRWLHTAGIVGARPDGSVPDTVGEQAAVIWDSIGEILGAAGMQPTDVVTITAYVVAGQDLSEVMAARDAFMGDHLPASTLVTVPALARAGWLIETSIVAAAE